MSYPEPRYLGETGLVSATHGGAVGEGPTMTDEERAAFMLRHDTFWT